MSADIVTPFEGRRFSFFQLIEEEKYSIEIPVIQRDYAQGRKSQHEVRELFLQALFAYLEAGIPNRDLDFVYGSTEEKGKSKVLIPLDGQQRLTTLFLLHWYLANISGQTTDFVNELLTDKKNSKFTYLTRTSSSEFCDALLQNRLDISAAVKTDLYKKGSIAAIIKDSGWYFLSWDNDPTIQSMLVMLDAIHEKFNDKPEWYFKLVDKVSPIITFLYLDLGEFKLTEDLYIKMNSRGKPLTPFENFKAKLEQQISGLFGDIKPYTLFFDGNEKKVSVKEYFSFNIDTKWANLFWQYKNLTGKDNTFDEELMNFIRVVISNSYISESGDLENYKILIKTEVLNQETSDYISFNKYMSLNALSTNSIQYLIKVLDVLENGNNKIKKNLNDSFYYNESEIFQKVLTHSLSFPERVLFYAYTGYLITNASEASGLGEWMRVVYNLIENTRIEEAENAANAIKAIHKLLPESHKILSFLTKGNAEIGFFFNRQVQEECLKSFLIQKSELWRSTIYKYERRAFFKGQLAFILEFSGILHYFESHDSCNWNEHENSAYYEQFIKYAEKSSKLFEILDNNNNTDFILERAVLTKGKYLIPASNYRFNFSSSSRVSNYQRDYSWKRLMRLPALDSVAEEIKNWEERRNYVRATIDDPNFLIDDVKGSLIKICKNLPEGWRKYFVENPALIRDCGQGFIGVYSEFKVELFNASQRNHLHAELRTYDLFLREFDDNPTLSPFEYHYYYHAKGDDISCIEIGGWCYKKINYMVEIYFKENESKSSGNYLIKFKKSKGEQSLKYYHDMIQEILKSHHYKWNEEELLFYVLKNNASETIKSLKELCKTFNNLVND